MNDRIEIVPLVGIRIGNQSIHLSDSKEKVEAVMGKPHVAWKNSFYYFENELRFDFGAQNLVESIEFLGGVAGKIQPCIYRTEAFLVDADTLYAVLKENNKGEVDDHESGYSYAFLNISVGIGRQIVPKNIPEMVAEAAKDGHPMQEAEIAYETKRATHWATIGMGVKDYY